MFQKPLNRILCHEIGKKDHSGDFILVLASDFAREPREVIYRQVLLAIPICDLVDRLWEKTNLLARFVNKSAVIVNLLPFYVHAIVIQFFERKRQFSKKGTQQHSSILGRCIRGNPHWLRNRAPFRIKGHIPMGPSNPLTPGAPSSPFGPWGPGGPRGPEGPGSPSCPLIPSKPRSPFSPGLPKNKQHSYKWFHDELVTKKGAVYT